MPPVIERAGPSFAYSLFRYLVEVEYIVGVTTAKLTVHHSQLEVKAGYPDDLAQVSKPRLALVTPWDMKPGAIFYGSQLREDEFPFALYGFVAGLTAAANQLDAANRLYRDRLFNDVYQLLSGDASDAGFKLYDEASKAEIGAVELYDVKGRLLLNANSQLDADRFRFVVEGSAFLS